MGVAEEGTLERLKALQRELVYPKIAEHRGHIVKTSRGILLVEFASVVYAGAMRGRGAAGDARAGPRGRAGQPHRLRIGTNLGDVIIEANDLYGDGVNIAAWIEALADAGGVFVSNTVHGTRPAALTLRGSQRPAAQGHHPAGAGLPGMRCCVAAMTCYLDTNSRFRSAVPVWASVSASIGSALYRPACSYR